MARAKSNSSPSEDDTNACPLSEGPQLFESASGTGIESTTSRSDLGVETFTTPLRDEASPAFIPHDPYDPATLGLSQNFGAEAKVAKRWDIIKVEKPSKSRVFLVHNDPKFRLKTLLLTLKEDNETYLVLPHLQPILASESLCGPHMLFACVTKVGTPFLWPIRMPDSDGKWNIWHQSAWQIAEKAQKSWARMQANRDAGYYTATFDLRPLAEQQQPAWPDMPFRDWLEFAFRGFTISSPDHPVLKRLRMED